MPGWTLITCPTGGGAWLLPTVKPPSAPHLNLEPRSALSRSHPREGSWDTRSSSPDSSALGMFTCPPPGSLLISSSGAPWEPHFSLRLAISRTPFGKPGDCPVPWSPPSHPRASVLKGEAVGVSQVPPQSAPHCSFILSLFRGWNAVETVFSYIPKPLVCVASSLLRLCHLYSKYSSQKSKKTFLSQQRLDLVNQKCFSFQTVAPAIQVQNV